MSIKRKSSKKLIKNESKRKKAKKSKEKLIFISSRSSSKKRTVSVEPTSNIDTSIITTSVSKGRTPWSAPMRGNNRRNVRPGGNPNPPNPPNVNLQRRIDHFRNRPLNTSRPPSMHVDEFEKQFNNENSNVNNSSTSNNNNDNNTNNANNDLLANIQSNTDGPSERV